MDGYIWVYVDSVAFVDAEELFKVCGGADTLFLTHYSARRTGLGWGLAWAISQVFLQLYVPAACSGSSERESSNLDNCEDTLGS